MSRYAKTQLMSVLPADAAFQSWARVGESLARCRARQKENAPASGGSHPTAPAGVSRDSHRVSVSATFDDEDVCVEISCAKEDGSPFRREEIAALLAANADGGARTWSQGAEREWRSDDGCVATLGKSGLGAHEVCYWMRICRDSTAPGVSKKLPMRTALSKPPATFEARRGRTPKFSAPAQRKGSCPRFLLALGLVGVAIVAGVVASSLRCAPGRAEHRRPSGR